MFATLVIVLPSTYSGGELLIRHRDREVCLDLSTDDSAEVTFAAFYAASVLPLEQAANLLERIVTRNTRQQAGARAELLESFSARCAKDLAASSSGASGALLRPLAAALVAARFGDPALAERAVDHRLAWPKLFAADAILVPATLQLSERADAIRSWGPTRRLGAVLIDHFEQHIAEALTPPSDFARASALACTCPHCRDLAAFLADPLREVWTLKAAQAQRRHVENPLRQHACDVDQKTERRGNPQALVCAKNQASFKRRLAQRRSDLDKRARLAMPTANRASAGARPTADNREAPGTGARASWTPRPDAGIGLGKTRKSAAKPSDEASLRRLRDHRPAACAGSAGQ